MFTPEKTQKISEIVIKILIQRFETFPTDAGNNRNAPFHEAFLKAFQNNFDDKVSDVPFFISLSSWLQGLNTTLGMSFFENVAQILSDGEKREYTSKKLGNLKIYKTQKDNINEILTRLSNSESTPNLDEETNLIFSDNGNDLVNAIDFSADVFMEDEEVVTAIEMKSVKPNSGEMRGEKQKILEGKAALSIMFPNKHINFFLGFPFDPTDTKPTGYDKTRFLGSIINMNKFFDQNEALVASELWDFVSGQSNTMEDILEIINAVSTPEFMDKLNFLQDNSNRNTEKYTSILNEWSLYSEFELLKRDGDIQEKIKGDKSLTRIYNQQTFSKDGYNWGRAKTLTELIK
jgi:hypothetical protein